MNRIFKTIFSKKNGKIIVVSENTSNQVRGECNTSHSTRCNHGSLELSSKSLTYIPKKALVVSILFSMNVLVSNDLFAITYDGTPSQLVNSDDVGGNFNQLIGNIGILGVAELNTSTSPAVIDYSQGPTPSFVLAGYSIIDSATQVNNNTITLDQGDVGGNIYSGLLHSTTVYPSIDCTATPNTSCAGKGFLLTKNSKVMSTSNNSISITDKNNINVLGTTNAGTSQINIDNGSFTSGVYNDATITRIDSVQGNTLQSSENDVVIQGSQHNIGVVNIGVNEINIKAGDFVGGTALAGGATKAYVSSQANARTNKC